MSAAFKESVLASDGVQLLVARLASAGQSHLLRYWGELDDARRSRLVEQIEVVDFALLARLRDEESTASRSADLAAAASPPPAFRLGDAQRERLAPEAARRGAEALRAGKLAVIVVAGGQGTRLGRQCPKGTIPVGPVSGRSLFQILFERVLAVGRRYGEPIPIYLMTSPATHAPTVAFLDEQRRFGLEAGDLHVFCQGVMPAICAATGEVLMADRDALCLAPNGHGGVLEALASSGSLAHAESRGIEHFFYCQVDNPLAPICDPELVGYHLLSESEMTTLAIAKTDPLEHVGNVVAIDGRVQILEYTELPAEIAAQRDTAGSLRLWAGNTGIHLFDLQFLRRAAASPEALPYHRALKTTPCLDPAGRLVTPAAPNSVKFERFIFDLLPLARAAVVVEGLKEEIFAPVKNSSGQATDTPETSQAAISALHRRWLLQAGARIAGDFPVEINPLYALDAEEFAAKLPPRTVIDRPTYFD